MNRVIQREVQRKSLAYSPRNLKQHMNGTSLYRLTQELSSVATSSGDSAPLTCNAASTYPYTSSSTSQFKAVCIPPNPRFICPPVYRNSPQSEFLATGGSCTANQETELYKFHILLDHLRLPSGRHIALSYAHDPQPFTKALAALERQYGQPHQLALTEIQTLLNLPKLARGDAEGFQNFAVRVRSLVGMLQSLKSREGDAELACASHVQRLLSKLPVELVSNFARHTRSASSNTHYNLVDFSAWLEGESECQAVVAQAFKSVVPKFKGEMQVKNSNPHRLPFFTVLNGGHHEDKRHQDISHNPKRGATKYLGLEGEPETLELRTVRQQTETLEGRTVNLKLSAASSPERKFSIDRAFTADTIMFVEQSYPIEKLKQRYQHLRDLPLTSFSKVQPHILIGSDNPFLITPMERIQYGPRGAPAAVRTRLGWALQGPTSLERKLEKNPKLADIYNNEINKLKETGYVAELDAGQITGSQESWYIPHHLVHHCLVYYCVSANIELL
ncbi:hypothetical protein JOB18_009345 [Solea senegalensis]|uniref:Uncharacterized protein n=1 Tax=Solea senegalensis TaxID=28829 RepID=A0AAV6RBM4_SOLSE|nr:hypothetical protein JOB18_009345 [Solea senegalensis]